MDKKLLAVVVVGAAAIAGAVALGTGQGPAGSMPDVQEAKGKEQCYGVGKAGENGCAANNGSHTCGGLSTIDNSGQEWMLVEAGTCLKMNGKLEAFDDATGTEPVAPPAAPPAPTVTV